MFPNDCPYVSIPCQDLILQLLQDKPRRLSSPKYRDQDQHIEYGLPSEHRKYVFEEDDAIEIKSHHWFRALDWNNLHNTTPGFTPFLRDAGDTRYFEEDEPISDWSESEDADKAMAPPEEIRKVLRRDGFRSRSIRSFLGLISQPYDTMRLRQIDQKIESFGRLTDSGKDVLKQYARTFGRKERKRPRDILLRDKRTTKDVMAVRKQSAFVGYTWLKAPALPPVPTLLEEALARARQPNLIAAFDGPQLQPFNAMPTSGPVYHEAYSYEAYHAAPAGQRYWHMDGPYDYMAGGYYWGGAYR